MSRCVLLSVGIDKLFVDIIFYYLGVSYFSGGEYLVQELGEAIF